MVAVKRNIFAPESDPRRDHQQIVLYSFCRSMRLLFISRLKYYFKSFCTLIEHVSLTYICRLYFPPECQQDRTLLRNTISENIPNI